MRLVHACLVNQRYFFYFVTLSNFPVIVLYPFRIKYGIIVSKCCLTHMGGVTPFVTKRYILVGGLKKRDFSRFVINVFNRLPIDV